MKKNFATALATGETRPEDVFAWIEDWYVGSSSTSEQRIYDHLGITPEDYDNVISFPKDVSKTLRKYMRK